MSEVNAILCRDDDDAMCVCHLKRASARHSLLPTREKKMNIYDGTNEVFSFCNAVFDMLRHMVIEVDF